MNHVWIVEAINRFSSEGWTPCLGFGGSDSDRHISGVHRNRVTAREAAKKMAEENQYNTDKWTSVRYKATKYVRED